jgi:arsenate reductase (glutaredoxin)
MTESGSGSSHCRTECESLSLRASTKSAYFGAAGEITPMLRIYTYGKCDTCRRALKFLREHKVAFEEIPIRDTPPSKSELKAMASAYGEFRKLFNSSGLDYKALNLSAKLPDMSEGEALKLLSQNGNLVKRPFLIGESVRLVGFKLPEWQAAFLAEGTLL